MCRRLAGVAFAVLLLGCGARVADSGGGNDSSTHWLESCKDDSDCGSLSCLCGVCSTDCEAKDDCSELSVDAVCEAAPGCARETLLCALACEDDDDCAAGECVEERCRARNAEDAGAMERDAEAPATSATQDAAQPDDDVNPGASGAGGGDVSLPQSTGGSSSGGSAGSAGGSTGPDGCNAPTAPPETAAVPPDLASVPWEGALSVDVEECNEAYFQTFLPSGSAWVAVRPDGESCEVWLGGETENPLYDGSPSQYCRFPRTMPCTREVNVEAGQGGPARVTSDACIPWVNPGPSSPTPAEFCDDPANWYGSSVDVDLTFAVESRTQQTGIACLGDDDAPMCCNWTWTAYVISCPTGDIVLSEEGAPFGSSRVPDDAYAEQFRGPDVPPLDVTMGCQGMDCSPTCTPLDAGGVQRVIGRLEPAEDGMVTPQPEFESVEAIAEFVVEADLSSVPPSLSEACRTLEDRFMTEWAGARACDIDQDCMTEFSGLCSVTFSTGARFSCDLPLNAGASVTALRSIEEQYRNECQQAADCDCQTLPTGCVDGQCTTLFEPRSEADLELCSPYDGCIVVDYDHCCGLTRRAINAAYVNEYENTPEWQRFDDCDPAAGACAPDDQLTTANCETAEGETLGRCVLAEGP